MKKTIILAIALTLNGCAFFNTFYNARKSYERGVDAANRARKQNREQNVRPELTKDVFTVDSSIPSGEATPFFDVAIEKTNKVVVLHPTSSWVENAILLMAKAYYLRGIGNDYLDARNRFEVFMTRYPDSPYLTDAKLWYGKTLIKLERYSEAEDALRQIPALHAKPDEEAEALILLGDILLMDNNLRVSLEYFLRAEEKAKEKSLLKTATFKSSYCYYQLGNHKLARDGFYKIYDMELYPSERFQVSYAIAQTLKSNNQFEQAISLLDALVGDPQYRSYFPSIEFEIAEMLRLKKEYVRAEKQYNHVLDEYRTSPRAGDCFYFLGWMNDSLQEGHGFKPNAQLALKYYTLVNTRYPSEKYSPLAKMRLEYIEKINFVSWSIRENRRLIDRLVWRRDHRDSAMTDVVGTSIGDSSVTSSEVKSNEKKVFQDESREGFPEDQRTVGSQKQELLSEEVRSVKIANALVENRKKELEAEWELILKIQNADSINSQITDYKRRIAENYIDLAEYFFNDLKMYDSSALYYQAVLGETEDSLACEIALYGLARIEEVSLSSLAGYRKAYESFPHGRLAPIGRKILGLAELDGDLYKKEFELAQSLLAVSPDDAEKHYRNVALGDTTRFKWPALFMLGLIHERADHAEKAFKFYSSLEYGLPNSIYTSKIGPKIEAYRKRVGLKGDSVGFSIDTAFVKPKLSVKEKLDPVSNTTISDTTLKGIDTTHMELNEKELEIFNKLMQDSTHVPNENRLFDDEDRTSDDRGKFKKDAKKETTPILPRDKKDSQKKDKNKDENQDTDQ